MEVPEGVVGGMRGAGDRRNLCPEVADPADAGALVGSAEWAVVAVVVDFVFGVVEGAVRKVGDAGSPAEVEEVFKVLGRDLEGRVDDRLL